MTTNQARTDAERLRERAERISEVEGHGPAESAKADDLAVVVHELRVHQIELELQNEELRHAQVALEASRARYQELFDLAPVGYLTLRVDGMITDANAAVERLLRVTRSRLLQRPFSDFIEPETQDAFYLLRHALMATAVQQRCDVLLGPADRPAFWAEIEGRVAFGPDGAPLLHMTFSDISARKANDAKVRLAAEMFERRVDERTGELQRSEAELRSEIVRRTGSELELQNKEAQLRAILDNASEAIVTTDESGRIELFNSAAERIFGWQAAEVVGRSLNVLIPPEQRVAHDASITRYLRTGERRAIGGGPREVQGVRKDGAEFVLELSVSEVRTDAFVRFTAILRDLTERRRLEDGFREAQKMAAIAQLASGIAHDFNNLLMGIIGCSNLASHALPETHPAAAAIGEIKAAAERGATLTRDLLGLSRQPRTVAAALSLNSAVNKIAGIIGSVLSEDIRMEIVLCPGDPFVIAELTGLEQILLNLVVNARDAMPAGGLLRVTTVETERSAATPTRTRVLPAGRYVELSVEDTGTGIAPELQSKVFEPFFTTKPVGAGSGLGLYSVFGIVERLGGAVELASEAGEGTRVTVVLPLHAPPEPGAQVEVAPPPSATAELSRELTVLVAEDEYLIRVAVKLMLADGGFHVLLAENCAAAENLAAGHLGPIDVLLTDIVLPDGNGGGLLRRLQATRRDLAVVYMSAYPTELLVQQGRIAEGTPSLLKPFDVGQLRAALHGAVTDGPRPARESASAL